MKFFILGCILLKHVFVCGYLKKISLKLFFVFKNIFRIYLHQNIFFTIRYIASIIITVYLFIFYILFSKVHQYSNSFKKLYISLWILFFSKHLLKVHFFYIKLFFSLFFKFMISEEWDFKHFDEWLYIYKIIYILLTFIFFKISLFVRVLSCSFSKKKKTIKIRRML